VTTIAAGSAVAEVEKPQPGEVGCGYTSYWAQVTGRSTEIEISHGRVSWQDCSCSQDQGPLASSIG